MNSFQFLIETCMLGVGFKLGPWRSINSARRCVRKRSSLLFLRTIGQGFGFFVVGQGSVHSNSKVVISKTQPCSTAKLGPMSGARSKSLAFLARTYNTPRLRYTFWHKLNHLARTCIDNCMGTSRMRACSMYSTAYP